MTSVALVLAAQIVSVSPPVSIDTVWLIAQDRTRSQSGIAFARIHGWNREIVLPLMAPGATVSLLFLDHAPGVAVEDPRTIRVDTGLRRFTADLVGFDALVSGQKQAPPTSQTDVAVLFHHLRRIIDLDRQTQVSRSYVLVALTDGEPTGPQTRPSQQPLPALGDADYRIVFIGVNEGTERGLRATASTYGFAVADRVLVVPHAQVDQSIASIQKFLGRKTDPNLARRLQRAAAKATQQK